MECTWEYHQRQRLFNIRNLAYKHSELIHKLEYKFQIS